MKRPSFVCATLGDLGGSAFYRVQTPLLSTAKAGRIQVRFPDKMQLFPIELLQIIRPDTLVFHRSHTVDQLKYLQHVTNNIDLLKVYAIDDWVGKVPKYSPHYNDIYKGIDKDIKKAIDRCDRLVVTNDLLANVYGYRKETHIIPNYLSEELWKPIYEEIANMPTVGKPVPRIGWSGGIGHPGDLEILREVADILGDRVRWVFLGDIPKGFDEGNSEVQVSNKGPGHYGLALHKLQLDLALVPLLDNEFNRAKSNIRITEYGACGYPVIASNVKPYKSAPVTLLEYNAKWWAEAILKKLEDPEALKAEGQALKEWVWANYKLEDHVKEYADIMSPDHEGFVPTKECEVEETVDVLITSYNNKEVLEQCVNSVLDSIPHNTTKINVVVSDNASTQPEMQDYLAEIGDKVQVQYLSENVGYIANINSAIGLHPDRDVVTLNSDTIVHGDWVDRLKEGCYANEQISSATPMSNNATVLSYPNPAGAILEPGLVRFYDEVVKDIPVKYIAIPSSIGFCTFIKRKALNDVGVFDNNAYGPAYGEENDWSMRALMRSWVSVASLNTYVGHISAATLSNEKPELLERAMATLKIRWPYYFQVLEQWGKAAPMEALRQSLDLAIIGKTTLAPRTLYFAHSMGGGLETYLQSRLKGTNDVVLRLNKASIGTVTLEVNGESYNNLPNIQIRTADLASVAEYVRRLNINRVSIQTTFGGDYNLPYWLMSLLGILDVPYEVMLHDYLPVCPRLRLSQDNGYCGEPDEAGCNACIVKFGSTVGQVDIGEWRRMYGKLLSNAEFVFAPSYDMAKRMEKYFPDLSIDVVPHEDDVVIGQWGQPPKYNEGDLIRVAVMGYMTTEKGSRIIEECSKYCLQNQIPMKFMVFGNMIDNGLLVPRAIEQNDALYISGPYQEQDLKSYLNLNKCHLSFFPNIWPETYSYTLSSAFKAALFPVAFDIGAIAERIKDKEFGATIPFEQRTDIPFIVNYLMETAKGLV